MTAEVEVLFFEFEKQKFLNHFGFCRNLLPKEFEFQDFARPELALPTLAARLMVLSFLRLNRADPQPWQTSSHGKPMAQSGHFFSISHSKNSVAVAFYHAEIGLDIEMPRSVNHQSFRRVFSAEELSYIGRSDDRFFELWTRKEALIKADGRGFSLPVNELNSLQNPVKIQGHLWHWQTLDLPHHHAHLACNDPCLKVRLKAFAPPY